MDKFHQFLTRVTCLRRPYFRLQTITCVNVWIFSKLGLSIDIVEIGLGLLMSKFQFLTGIFARNIYIFGSLGKLRIDFVEI